MQEIWTLQESLDGVNWTTSPMNIFKSEADAARCAKATAWMDKRYEERPLTFYRPQNFVAA